MPCFGRYAAVRGAKLGDTRREAAHEVAAAHHEVAAAHETLIEFKLTLVEFKERTAAANKRLATRLYHAWRDQLLRHVFNSWKSVFYARNEVRPAVTPPTHPDLSLCVRASYV